MPVPLTTPGVDITQIELTPNRLGRGSFGTVYRGLFAGCPVAIKVCPLSSTSPKSRSAAVQFRRESARYATLRHPCITQFFCSLHHSQSNSLLLVTELMRGGSLYDSLSSLRRARVSCLPNESILRIALQITNGLAYLHASKFSFGDLKSMNILLSEHVDVKRAAFAQGTHAKLCDFGLSRNLTHLVPTKSHPSPDETVIPGRHGPAGTFAYLAPEAFAGMPTDDPEAPKNADVYALGVVLWELATLKRPWIGLGMLQLVKIVAKEKKKLSWTEKDKQRLPEAYIDLVESCWNTNPRERPSAEHIGNQLERMYDGLPSQDLNGDCTLKDSNAHHVHQYAHGSHEKPELRSEVTSLENSHIHHDLTIQHVEEVQLSEDELFRLRSVHSAPTDTISTVTSLQHTHFSDVTGESRGNGDLSNATEEATQSHQSDLAGVTSEDENVKQNINCLENDLFPSVTKIIESIANMKDIESYSQETSHRRAMSDSYVEAGLHGLDIENTVIQRASSTPFSVEITTETERNANCLVSESNQTEEGPYREEAIDATCIQVATSEAILDIDLQDSTDILAEEFDQMDEISGDSWFKLQETNETPFDKSCETPRDMKEVNGSLGLTVGTSGDNRSSPVQKRGRSRSYYIPRKTNEDEEEIDKELEALGSVPALDNWLPVRKASQSAAKTDENSENRETAFSVEDEVGGEECLDMKKQSGRTVVVRQHSRSYSLPSGHLLHFDLEKEIAVLEENDSMGVESSGVNMFARSHFR